MDQGWWTPCIAALARDRESEPDGRSAPRGDEPSLPRPISLTNGDWLAVVGLVVVATVFIRWRGNFSLSPWEDAAMLLRYSENLASGHGIVWNVGEGPEDGATDFLFMLQVALVRHLGMDLVPACRVVGSAFHLATIPLVYWAVRGVAGAPRPLALLSAGYIALGPGVRYIEAGFGTTVFAFFVALSATAWIALWRAPARPALGFCLGCSCLAMGLARPEGAALAVLLALSLMLLVESRNRTPIAIRFGLTFGLFGSIYFAWHWLHFGYPLPNPIYIRAVDAGHLRSLRDAIKNALWLLLPFAPAFALHLWKGERRVTAALVLPTAGFVALWFVISHSMNFMMRYQYPLLPLVVIMWAPTSGLVLASLGDLAQKIALSASILIAAGVLLHIHKSTFQQSAGGLGDERRDVGLALSRFSHRYTMVTTEAGQLPLYSAWRAVDAGGLNDSWIAHHGLTAEYLEQNHPAVIVIASFTYASDGWRQMAACLEGFAKSRRYLLAFRSPGPSPLEFYVAPWSPESLAIVESIEHAEQAAIGP
jgi:arabinofuranosyltransferase